MCSILLTFVYAVSICDPTAHRRKHTPDVLGSDLNIKSPCTAHVGMGFRPAVPSTHSDVTIYEAPPTRVSVVYIVYFLLSPFFFPPRLFLSNVVIIKRINIAHLPTTPGVTIVIVLLPSVLSGFYTKVTFGPVEKVSSGTKERGLGTDTTRWWTSGKRVARCCYRNVLCAGATITCYRWPN